MHTGSVNDSFIKNLTDLAIQHIGRHSLKIFNVLFYPNSVNAHRNMMSVNFSDLIFFYKCTYAIIQVKKHKMVIMLS